MSLKQELIAEIKSEFSNTRKTLERVPSDKFDWRPHEKSMSLKSLAKHVADLTAFPAIMVTTDYLDFHENQQKSDSIETTEDLLKIFDEGYNNTIKSLEDVSEFDLEKNWIMRAGDHIILDAPRKTAIRSMALSHSYHHRAQLGVYLRLLDIPVPGAYGPSADEV
ncbi:MAG: DinB family protein [Brumimicrobium sp.]